VITLEQMQARVNRLGQLEIGLGKEQSIWKEAEITCRLTWQERKSYLKAISDAAARIREARVTMAKALARLKAADTKPMPPPLLPSAEPGVREWSEEAMDF
jgi:hypothetical protein